MITSREWLADLLDPGAVAESEAHWFESIEDHYADVNDISLHYVAAGEGDPIIFVHGFPCFWYTWRHQIAELSKTHRVIAPDMRGYALSSKPEGIPNYRIRVIVDDLRALIEDLGLERVTMVGDDWGGAISWAFAIYYPELLDRLVIVSTAHPQIFDHHLKHNPAQQEASQYFLGLRQIGVEEALLADDCALLREPILDLDFRNPGERAIYLRAWSEPEALRAGCDWYRDAWLGPKSEDGTSAHANGLPEVRDQVVKVPTLMIKAQGCPYFLDDTVEGLDELVPDLRLEMVPTESHWITEEKPEVVNELIRSFVGSPAPAPIAT